MPGRAPYDVVRCPAGVVRGQPDTVRCPVDFTRIFTCNDEYMYIKIAIIPPKKQFVKIRKIEADADSDGEKHTCSRQQQNSIALVRCMLIILSCSSEIYYLYSCFWSLEIKYLCKCNMFFCKNTSLLTGGSLTHETSVCARTGIVRCPDRHRPVSGRASSGARTGIVRCPDGHRPIC